MLGSLCPEVLMDFESVVKTQTEYVTPSGRKRTLQGYVIGHVSTVIARCIHGSIFLHFRVQASERDEQINNYSKLTTVCGRHLTFITRHSISRHAWKVFTLK